MKFAYWMLQLPDGTEAGPIGVDEVKSLLPKDKTLLGQTRIRAKEDRFWVVLARHSHCHLFLAKDQQAAVLKSIVPSAALPDIPPKPAREKPSEKRPEPSAGRKQESRPQPTFTSVEDILDFNAACAGQELVRDRIRANPRKWRPRSRILEYLSGIIFYNALLFGISYGMTLCMVATKSLKLDASVLILAWQMLITNPISLVSLVAGVALITMGMFWLVFVIPSR